MENEIKFQKGDRVRIQGSAPAGDIFGFVRDGRTGLITHVQIFFLFDYQQIVPIEMIYV